MTRYGSQIIQNGKEIKLRTTKEEFNASKRTLSRVLADITVNAMKGIYLRYDENGAITSHTIDKNDDELLNSFERRNRSKVRLALKRGTTVERSDRVKVLKTFAELMKITGERDGFLTRDISYFENI
ncbi:peptidoglycan bridge formation glycyltransferase FemA/FemB family protein, partial [Staphylococcus aureus]|uniref:peptidoglycan bridge formation glycyltransferase FemA/FemB family protein n=1 Tax=Staphylococcus aureus TaxID=1280 RepID=UPI001CD4522E